MFSNLYVDDDNEKSTLKGHYKRDVTLKKSIKGMFGYCLFTENWKLITENTVAK